MFFFSAVGLLTVRLDLWRRGNGLNHFVKLFAEILANVKFMEVKEKVKVKCETFDRLVSTLRKSVRILENMILVWIIHSMLLKFVQLI